MVSVVIMAGGKGERFWPRSRKKMPKQLLSLTGDGKTMIQLTVERMKKLVDYENIYVVTNEDYATEISNQLKEVPTENILVEPMGKNTAPCIGLAAIHVMAKDPESIMIILPSDHLIKDNEEFIEDIKYGIRIAQDGKSLVTIGIQPDYPETGYGYINFEKESIKENSKIHKVKGFVEKPNIDKAKEYLKSRQYLWNSGMFIWKASTILNEMQVHMPNLYEGLIKIQSHLYDGECDKILLEEYSKFESISIDYGIMEKASDIFTIAGNFGWDDIGSWTALERISNSDQYGNIINGNIISLDTKKCIIQGMDKLIATIGVEDLVVVDTEDATLICSKDKCQNIKDLLNEMKLHKKESYL